MDEAQFKKSVCVFCGAQDGDSEKYKIEAYQLGSLLARLNLRLVYGGGMAGLMGATADGALASNGLVLGVLPKLLADLEVGHLGIQTLMTVESMAERKRILLDESDVFVILPGGLGTLDELFEVLTANTLGFMNKPVIILNSNGYYSELLGWLETIASRKFSRRPSELYSVAADLRELELLLA
ncbi:MAG: hypothetical protein RJB13_592 [Pseudomonadota bacterium]|jgi:uncharacterized protein (TIGR00730 family)